MSLKALIARNGPVTFAAAVPAVPAVLPADEPPITARTATTATATTESPKSELAAVAWADRVRCADCAHWQPSGVQQHGDCAAGAGGTTGLWATDARACESWLPHGLADAVRAMAERWAYEPDELAWALEQATQHPAEWLRLIAADLAGRRWPGGESWQEGEL